jgi:asparagine synthase (glutamine-hydrolysing)
VALSGDGGDELFAGYDPFKALAPARLYQQLVPRGLHRGLRSLAELLPISHSNMSLDFKVRRALSGLDHAPAYWNPVWLAPAEPAMLDDLFNEPVRAEELYEEAVDLWDASAADTVDRTLEFYTNFYLPDDILTKVDRASMMVSLESRAVFLDPDLAEFCRRLPNRMKFRKGQRKWLLKRAFREALPKEVLARPKKGFGIPLAAWLRRWPEPDDTAAWTDYGLRPDMLHEAWEQHAAGVRDHRSLLFAWMCLHHHRQPALV